MRKVRLGRVCALVAVCIAALATTASATYAAGTEKCGESIIGVGSSLQNIAQKSVWLTGFQSGKGWEKSICEKEPGTIEYLPTSSGKGLALWGANGAHELREEELENEKKVKVKVFPAYVGTDVGPEGPAATAKTQLNEMDEAGHQGTAAGEGVVTVPVAQSAVTVDVQLPKECLGTLKEKEVVSITSEKLEKEWLKNEIDWKGLITGTATGAKSECTTEKAPTRYARFSASGTTAGFKRFIGDLESGADKTVWAPFIATAAKSESPSEWPAPVPTEEACGVKLEKGSQLATAVFGCETAKGAIGYSDLADALKAGFEKEAKLIKPTGKEYYVAIVRVQNNAYGSATPVYQSPEKAGESNCKKANYFKEKTLEVKGNEDWSGAKEENLEKGESEAYPICTLTFDTAWHLYEKVGKYTEQKANSVFAYLHYIVFEGQGSTLTSNHYGVLPTAVKEKAEAGLKETNATKRIIRWK